MTEMHSHWFIYDRDAFSVVRPMTASISSSTKGQHYRKLGVLPKFSRKSDLLTFQRKVAEHLELHDHPDRLTPNDPITLANQT